MCGAEVWKLNKRNKTKIREEEMDYWRVQSNEGIQNKLGIKMNGITYVKENGNA